MAIRRPPTSARDLVHLKKLNSTPHCDKICARGVIEYIKTPLREKREQRKDFFTEMCAARDRKPGFDSEFTGTELKIKLRGEIDHHSAVAVRSAIDDMIRTKRPAELIIDMSAVDFMDSSGLGLIMGRYNTIKEIGGSVKVSDPSPSIEQIMKLAGPERIIMIVRSVQKDNKTVANDPPLAVSVTNSAQTASDYKASRAKNTKEVDKR